LRRAEEAIDPAKLVSILHYDGTPITARFIADAIGGRLGRQKVVPFREAVS
jgi:2-oxoglutarate ferredoxin oxidoreductase subunit alpha